MLEQEDLAKPNFEGAKYVCSPPLREKWNQEELWKALKNGYLHTVGSDQCSFNFVGQKDLGKDDFSKIPNGMPTIEDHFSIVFSEGVKKRRGYPFKSIRRYHLDTRCEVVRLIPTKRNDCGREVNADIVIFDPNAERTISASTHHMNVDYNPFEGMKVTGEPVSVLSRGEFVIRDKQYVGKPGMGQYLKRKRFTSEVKVAEIAK